MLVCSQLSVEVLHGSCLTECSPVAWRGMLARANFVLKCSTLSKETFFSHGCKERGGVCSRLLPQRSFVIVRGKRSFLGYFLVTTKSVFLLPAART